MKRKVIRQGHNRLTITLPIKWCKKIGLKGGEEIDMEENNSTIIVNAIKNSPSKSISISSDNLERISAAKVISACYELGLDKITIELGKKKTHCWYFGDEDFVRTINFFVDRLVGFEVTTQTDNRLVIEKLSEPLLKFDSISAKLFSMLLEGIQNYIDAQEKNQPHLLDDAESRHDNITRFTSLAWRMIYEDQHLNKAELLNYFVIIHQLDKVSDLTRCIYRHAGIDKSLNKNMIEFAKKCKKYVDLYRSFYYNYDLEKINKLEEIRGDLKRIIPTMKKVNDIRITGYFEAIIEVMYGAIKPRILIEVDKKSV